MRGFWLGFVAAAVLGLATILAVGITDEGQALAIGIGFGIAGTSLGTWADSRHD